VAADHTVVSVTPRRAFLSFTADNGLTDGGHLLFFLLVQEKDMVMQEYLSLKEANKQLKEQARHHHRHHHHPSLSLSLSFSPLPL
jgi:hypothetical protein